MVAVHTLRSAARKRVGAPLAALLVGVTLAACGGGDSGGGGGGDGTLTMDVGVQSLVLQTYYPQLAQELGYFDDEKLKVNITVGESTANSVQGLIGQSIDAYLGGPEGLAANEQGAQLRFIAAGANRSIWNIVATPDINSIQDLAGKNLGVSALQSISTVTMRQALQANGVDPNNVKFIIAGGTSKRFSALQAKRVSAAPLGIPINYQASETAGMKDFGNTNKIGAPPLVAAVVTVSKKWADGHKEELRRFLRAYQRTIDALYNPQMKSQISQLVAKGLKVDAKYADRAIDEVFLKSKGELMPKDAHIDLPALQTSADAFLSFGALKKQTDASSAVDHSYLEDAQKSLKDNPPKS